MSSILLDEPAAHESTSAAKRLRTTMAAVRVSMSWFDPQDFDGRTARRSRRALRSQCPVSFGRQETDRHQAPGLQGGHGRSGQGPVVLEVAVSALS